MALRITAHCEHRYPEGNPGSDGLGGCDSYTELEVLYLKDTTIPPITRGDLISALTNSGWFMQDGVVLCYKHLF